MHITPSTPPAIHAHHVYVPSLFPPPSWHSEEEEDEEDDADSDISYADESSDDEDGDEVDSPMVIKGGATAGAGGKKAQGGPSRLARTAGASTGMHMCMTVLAGV